METDFKYAASIAGSNGCRVGDAWEVRSAGWIDLHEHELVRPWCHKSAGYRELQGNLFS